MDSWTRKYLLLVGSIVASLQHAPGTAAAAVGGPEGVSALCPIQDLLNAELQV